MTKQESVPMQVTNSVSAKSVLKSPMRLSLAFTLLIILLSLTLGWKVAAVKPTRMGSKIDIAAFLSRHGFRITEQIVITGLPVVAAAAGACRLKIVEVSPDGWTRDIVRYHIAPSERQFVLFRGRIYTEQPTWLTISYYWWTRSLRQIGLGILDVPVFVVSSTASCDAERLPWNELSRQDSYATT
jgi:hypothetical protein